jgi:hypothetical protein
MDAIYFELSQAFNKVPHTLLLYKLNSWFQSYLSSRNSSFRILGKFLSSFSVLLGIPQGSTLGPLLFNIYINDICTEIRYSNFLLFAEDLKLYHAIKSAEDCKCLQADIHLVKERCFGNCIKLNTQKTNVISFTHNTNSIHFDYHFVNAVITRIECM